MTASLPPPDPATCRALVTAIHEGISWHLRFRIEQHIARERGDASPESIADFYRYQAIYLYEAMIDWMGPGGDEAFLTMYVLANGNAPSLTVGAADRSASVGTTMPSQARIAEGLSEFRTMDKEARQRPQANRGNHPWTTVLLPRVETIFVNRSATASHSDVSLEFVVITVSPTNSYRHDLMGELATPWEVFEGPMPFYRPQRHVAPADRPYDESGYILP